MIPSGQSWQAETTSSHYSFFWPFTISFYSSLQPLSHSHFVSYIFTDAFPAAANPFASHSLTLVRLSNILPYQSSTVVLWFWRKSSFSASSPVGGFTKQTASSKWNLNLNSELWAFLPREMFHQKRQLYTLADAHTQAHRETPSSIHVNTHEHVHAHTQTASRNFHLVYILSVCSFSSVLNIARVHPVHSNCGHCLSLTQIAGWKLRKTLQLSGLFSRAK